MQSSTPYGLKPDVVLRIQQVFAQFPAINRVVLYGSRAKGNYRSGSDIDITIHTDNDAPNNLLFDVMGALDDLDLIYSFDVSLFSHLDNPDFIAHIERVGVDFYQRERHKKGTALAQQHQTRSAGYQSEAQLEENLIKRLCGELSVYSASSAKEIKEPSGDYKTDEQKTGESQSDQSYPDTFSGLGYTRVKITNADELKANLKRKLEVHNKVTLTEGEFNKILNHLDKGNVFERAKTLRDRFALTRDDGSKCYIQFFNSEHWCQNQYQVTNQITQEGKYQNRYDITLLINGLPLVQIELKRRGVELKEAFNQINRYQRHSFWAENGLFNYVQLFVISNGVNTKYYANNRKQNFKQTFFWADKDNNKITHLDDFADAFLERCHVSKMIAKYIVLHESDKILMALRPYQYYAVEEIVNRVKHGRKNGYIWHTTGSGKTLTSYKAAQILTALPKVHKVVFVVDRADLDYQTTREFNFFSEGSVDGTNNTKALVKQMAGDNPLIVTTIQKLNTAIKAKRHESAMEALKDKRVVFIFDECHRSQFGDTHKNIVGFFTKAQMFGFTGTPILKKNAATNEHGKRTTKDLFGECLHKYVITNAIADDNVLPFSIEYWGKLKRKDGSLMDEQVTGINRKEFFENEIRINSIVDWIILNHNRKTHNKQFSAMLCVSSKEALMTYYEAFKRKREAGEHDLRVATIFTYGTNEEDADANGMIGDPDFDFKTDDAKNKHSREKLEEYVEDYNALYQTKHSVKDSKAFYTYYKDIAKRMKERDREDFKDKDRCDILLVVNMYLTGFDAKKLNTLYVDKNLKHHGLIQAFSRTNRTLGELKSQGNVVCFRNLKNNADEAIGLFSNPDAETRVFIEPYENYVEQFNEAVIALRELAETPADVDLLIDEVSQAAFVKAFRALMRTLNVLKSFTEFVWQDLILTEQEFEDYKSKYLDIYDRSRADNTAASIIHEVDFELELLHRDEINVAYILQLLSEIKSSTDTDQQEQKMKSVLDLLGHEPQLRSKRELIEKFMQEYMPNIAKNQNLEDVFVGYWNKEKRQAVHDFCTQERMDKDTAYKIMDEYNFTGKEPLREQVFAALDFKPKLMERKAIYNRILAGFKEIVQRYEDDTGALSLSTSSVYDYAKRSIQDVVNHIGDKELFFTDEIKQASELTELAKFSIRLDTPYQDNLASLTGYQNVNDLLGRGIVSDVVLTEYLSLTAELQTVLEEYGLQFGTSTDAKDGDLFWSFTEAREGSTILDFAINAYGYAVAIGGPIVAFLALYDKASTGFEKLQEHIKARFSSSDKDGAGSSIIITENLAAEMQKLKSE